MLKKKDCVIYSVFIYIVLILTIYLNRDKKRFDSNVICRVDFPCVRFCCDNIKTCNDEFIRKYFNESLVQGGEDEMNQVKPRVKLMFGKPKCKLEMIGEDKEWSFTPVNNS